MLNTIVRKLKALHQDEQGANMIEYVLIFAAIALPLILVIVWFKDAIVQWATGLWDTTKSGGSTDPHGT